MENMSVDELLKRKRASKDKLVTALSLAKNKPLLALFMDNDLSTREQLAVEKILEGLAALDIDVVVLADKRAESLSKNVAYLPYSRINRISLLEAADMALVFPFSDVEEIMLNGVIPISMNRPGIKDYNPNKETGNGFVYKKEDSWSIFAALVRAVETFKFPYDWKHIVRQGILSEDSKN